MSLHPALSSKVQPQCYVKPQCCKTVVEYMSLVWDPLGKKPLQDQVPSLQLKTLRWVYSKWYPNVRPTVSLDFE